MPTSLTDQTTTATTRPKNWKYQPYDLKDKRILITGGTTGIGRTTAQLLASQGARLIIFGRNPQHLDDALNTLADYGDHVHGLTADVAVEDGIDKVFEHVQSTLGGLDILINNAGLPASSVTDQIPSNYRYIIETNLLGYMSCARRAIPLMRDAGGGSIINIGSLSARSQGEGSDVYVATKSALRGWTHALAKQVHEDSIYVSLIEPGKVGADFQPEPPSKERREQADGELLFTECIAEAILYVATQPKHCVASTLAVEPLHNLVA